MEPYLYTFLCVCETLNFRKAAELLHLSQPAISKQMKSLEEKYGVKLFVYTNRKLSVTKQGKLLREYALSMKKCDEDLVSVLQREEKQLLRVGVTKTIGDFYIGPAVVKYLSDPDRQMDITMNNTEELLFLLENNVIDLALVEGMIDKNAYQTFLIKEESFVGICSAKHRFAGRTIDIRELKKETVVVREHGSGTRDLFEKQLTKAGYGIDFFERTVTISNFALIKNLVEAQIGISFAYETIIQDGDPLATFRIRGFSDKHEFNAVILKHLSMTQNMKDFLPLLP